MPDFALRRGFDEHIGVGFSRNLKEATRLQTEYQSDWKPMEFIVDRIHIYLT